MWICKKISLKGITMNQIWEYPLPTNEKSIEHQFEGPILAGTDYLYYAVKTARNVTIHVVDNRTGQGTVYPFSRSEFIWVGPKDFFGFFHNGLAYYFTADLHVFKGSLLIKTIPLSENREFNTWLHLENRLYLAIGHRPFEKLLCIDLDAQEILWSLNIGSTKNYVAGALSFFEGNILCYGLDHLLFVKPEDGSIEKKLKLPRIDKLFCPLRQEDDTLLIGYTNWTNAGVLCYDETTQKILWRYKRQFQGPLGNCRLYPYGDKIYWTKNDTELICLNRMTGEEISRVRTAPWRYTPLQFHDKYLLFGTSGSDGFLYCVDAEQCAVRWTIPLKEGCMFFGIRENSAYCGDYNNNLLCISLKDGMPHQPLSLDAEVIGDIEIGGNALYTVIWGNEEKPIRLVKISLD